MVNGQGLSQLQPLLVRGVIRLDAARLGRRVGTRPIPTEA